MFSISNPFTPVFWVCMCFPCVCAWWRGRGSEKTKIQTDRNSCRRQDVAASKQSYHPRTELQPNCFSIQRSSCVSRETNILFINDCDQSRCHLVSLKLKLFCKVTADYDTISMAYIRRIRMIALSCYQDRYTTWPHLEAKCVMVFQRPRLPSSAQPTTFRTAPTTDIFFPPPTKGDKCVIVGRTQTWPKQDRCTNMPNVQGACGTGVLHQN